MPETFAVTDRTEVRRLPARGHYERATAHAILDEALVCHLGFADEQGRPVVIPTLFARDGDVVYLHGSPASRTLRALGKGLPVCMTVTLTDGLVLAKSAFHHSINYRSVVVFGTASVVSDLDVKRRALDRFVEHVVPGRPPSRSSSPHSFWPCRSKRCPSRFAPVVRSTTRRISIFRCGPALSSCR